MFDTGRLLFALPENKGLKWIRIIKQFIADSNSSSKALEKMIGCLVRVSIIIPSSSSFLKELRFTFYSVIKGKSTFNQLCIANLKLWIRAIECSIEGTSITKIILRMPTLIFFTDALGAALGGFNLNTCCTWNFDLLPNILDYRIINYLEFLALLV